MRMKSPSYVRLLNLMIALRELSPFAELTADEEQLLDKLIVKWDQSGDIRVSDMMNGSSRASGSAIYRRLVGLRDKGMIVLRTDADDKRVRLIEPTAMADDYVKHLGRGIEKLIRSEKLA